MAAYFIAKIARSNSKLKLEDGKVAVLVHDDKVAWAFIRNYWNDIRKKIKDGAVEKGELTWESISSFMTVLDTLGLGDKYSIPDDIIGAFAGKENEEDDLRVTFSVPAEIVDFLEKSRGDANLAIDNEIHDMLKDLWLQMNWMKEHSVCFSDAEKVQKAEADFLASIVLEDHTRATEGYYSGEN